MNVVGKVGSLISQGVYSVATPFHPFGGAVDIIVVEQQDGTFRSTPWYVRFGKFQGVLKGAEKVVAISVNGIEADFHMYLDNSGEAYFMREVTPGSEDESNDNEPSPADNVDENQSSFDESKEISENNEYELDDGSSRENGSEIVDNGSYHYGNLDDVEIMVDSSKDTNSEMVLVCVDGHVLTAPISSNEENTDDVQLDTPQFHLGPGEGSGDEFYSNGNVWEDGLCSDMDISSPKNPNHPDNQSEGSRDTKNALFYEKHVRITGDTGIYSSSENLVGLRTDDTFKSCSDINEGDSGSPSIRSEPNDSFLQSPRISSFSDQTVEEGTPRGSHDFRNALPVPCSDSNLPCNENSLSISIDGEISGNNVCTGSQQKDNNGVSLDLHLADSELHRCDYLPTGSTKAVDDEKDLGLDIVCTDMVKKDKEVEDIPGRSSSEEECDKTSGIEKSISGLGIEISLCGNLLHPGMGLKSAEEAFEAHRIPEEEFKASGATIVKNGNLIIRWKERYVPWEKAAHVVLGLAVFGCAVTLNPEQSIPIENEDISKGIDDAVGVSSSSSRRWRLWPIPFRRVRSIRHSNSSAANEDPFVDAESRLREQHTEPSPCGSSHQSPRKKFLRTNIPTTEQIASLNLKDGQNMIAFSFSTRVLGKQQVDAHIFLWKWNARIVISDVDGTITKSDVLGQVMPLVGKDWSQSGVARLFSAIRDNGYQLLFLSARAIVQAYLTRSFLLNLKQDGKALPSGPVVISPDGLFPSLFREVIRRAPHEFKIACLEDIKALFPSDYNPFYAGFGNRDTDELSYRKIGIPKGKIFIINPMGEVAINNCIDVKSYTSLHTLVNDMFPPTSLVEQEDFNSWNYWKMPLPSIEL